MYCNIYSSSIHLLFYFQHKSQIQSLPTISTTTSLFQDIIALAAFLLLPFSGSRSLYLPCSSTSQQSELAFYTVRSWVSMVCNALHNLIFSATFLHPVYSSPAILSSCPFFVENAQNGLISGPLHLPFLCP